MKGSGQTRTRMMEHQRSAMDEDEAPQLLPPKDSEKDGPEIDEDGFTKVKRKGKGHR